MEAGGIRARRARRRSRFGAAFAVLVVAAAGLWSGAAIAGAAETPQSVTVRILDDGLEPAAVQIEPGATVVWVNRASGPRSIVASDSSFDSGELAKGEQFQFAFTEARSVSYAVAQAPSVTGTIVVGDAEPAAPAPTPFAPSPAPAGPTGPPTEFAFTGSATSVHALVGGLVVALGAGLVLLARRYGVTAVLSRLTFSIPHDDLLPTRRHRRELRTEKRRGRPWH